RAPRINSGPRIDQRSRVMPFSKREVKTSNAPSKPSSTARPFGSVPGPIPPPVPPGRSRPSQKANPATAMIARPPTKSCRDSKAFGDRDGRELFGFTGTLESEADLRKSGFALVDSRRRDVLPRGGYYFL